MLKITMNNPGGEIDSRTAANEKEAVEVLRAMIEDCGELHDGDTFTITEVES